MLPIFFFITKCPFSIFLHVIIITLDPSLSVFIGLFMILHGVLSRLISQTENTYIYYLKQNHRYCLSGLDSSCQNWNWGILMMVNNHKYKKCHFCKQNGNYYTTFSATHELFSPNKYLNSWPTAFKKSLLSVREWFFFIH